MPNNVSSVANIIWLVYLALQNMCFCVVFFMQISVRIDDSQCVTYGEQKRWQCNLCDKSYTTKHNLVMHILDHNGIKPHLCLVCGKYFKQLSHLNTHMLTHDNVRPHVCTVCSNSSSYTVVLRKAFLCIVCLFFF